MNARFNLRAASDANIDTKERPIKHSCCVSLRRDVHWKSLILTLLIYGCLSAIVWCRLASITTVVMYYNRYSSQKEINSSSPCADGYIYIPVAFTILLYLVYLVECWHCHTRIELRHKVDVQTVYHKMRQMKEALPIIWWKAVCYHYVRRTRQVTRYRNGDAFTSTQVYYERVNSHSGGCAFNFTNCGFKDVTKYITGLEDYSATKIRFSKTYSFAHPDAKYEFDDQRNQFFTENERRDDYMETREGMDLLNVNFKEFMVAFKDPDNLPWYVSHVVFWLASCLLLTWPLRVIIEYKTAFIHYHVHKVFGTNYANEDEQATRPMTRVNTIASAELDMIVRNNFTIVPSYSEALLLDTNAASSYTLHDANANVTSPVFGPKRSKTWNNISNSISSGYLSGFFSSASVPRYSSCTLVNDGIIVQDDGNEPTTSQNTLKNIFRSPWNRKRKRFVPETSHNTMFMLTSPDSPDDYSVAVNQRLSPIAHSSNVPSSVGEMSQKDNSGSCVRSNALKNNKTSFSFLSHSQSSHDTHQTSNTIRMINCSPSQHNKRIKIQDLDDLNTPISKKSKFPTCTVVRPNTIANFSMHSSNPSEMISVCDCEESSRSPKTVFIKSNLPCVPISNILSERSPTQMTPTSPPCYEDALYMQQPTALSANNTPNMPERRSLLDGQEQRRYNAIMETSL